MGALLEHCLMCCAFMAFEFLKDLFKFFVRFVPLVNAGQNILSSHQATHN